MNTRHDKDYPLFGGNKIARNFRIRIFAIRLEKSLPATNLYLTCHRSIYFNYYYYLLQSFSISPWRNFNTMNPRSEIRSPSIDRKQASSRPVAHFGSLGLIICPVFRPGETCTHTFLFLSSVFSWQQEKIQQDFLGTNERLASVYRDSRSTPSNERGKAWKVIAGNNSIRISFAFLHVSL